MNKDDFDFVAPVDLRVGLFVDLDVGWMAHPFPSSRFKISGDKQIEILRGLGLKRIRYVPSKSDAPDSRNTTCDAVPETEPSGNALAQEFAQKAQRAESQRAELRAQQQRLAVCERRFTESAQQYRKVMDLLHTKPLDAGQQCKDMVRMLAHEMKSQGDAAIRLLTEAAGDKAALHPVNVTVISLLLGRAMGMDGLELEDLGIAAFLHDVGKIALPERVRRMEDNFSSAELKVYQDHVMQSVRMAKQMDLNPGAVQAIAQHHELADGSGFPEHQKLDAMSKSGRILALVNRYDDLCNPFRASAAMTPHEALALIFAQQKTRFDGAVLSAFIRMMGVYPPGSVVQLSDERYAMVVSVNSSRPLKPSVLVYEPGVHRPDALLLDMERVPNTSIRRSLKPSSLPAAIVDYLQPRSKVCYFFEPTDGAVRSVANVSGAGP